MKSAPFNAPWPSQRESEGPNFSRLSKYGTFSEKWGEGGDGKVHADYFHYFFGRKIKATLKGSFVHPEWIRSRVLLILVVLVVPSVMEVRGRETRIDSVTKYIGKQVAISHTSVGSQIWWHSPNAEEPLGTIIA